MVKRLPLEKRKEIFRALVDVQDRVNNVRQSYEQVTDLFEISESQLRQIEDEGIDKEWPPLSEVELDPARN